MDHVNKLMEEHKQDREQYGCMLMCDRWTNRRNRTLINPLGNSPKETMFLKFIDTSSFAKDANMMYELLDAYVEDIREANMVQIVTDSASANVLASENFNLLFNCVI